MNLRDRLELAGGALLALLDPDAEHMPTGGWEVAHDLGRWWDAALRLEAASGFVIPAELEASSLHNLARLTDNPDRLLTNRADVPWLAGKVRLNPHNFRESFLAFGGLVRRRQSRWARQAALQLVDAMARALQADGSLDCTRLGSWGRVPHTQDPSHTEPRRAAGWFDGTATSGRSLEALVWLYEATGEGAVFDLAQRLAAHHLAASIDRTGRVRAEIVDPTNVGHCHSYLGTLRGLLLFGLLTDQRQYVDAVEATYRIGLRDAIVRLSGWAPHDLGKLRFPNEHGDPVTDPASAGDAAQLALWLGLRAGCHDLLDDVERLVRARLLPAQVTAADVAAHPERTFTAREVGAWAIHGPSHGGKGCTPDVLAAVAHTLCDVQSNLVAPAPGGFRVNLHFDYEGEALRVSCARDETARVAVTMRQGGDLWLRVPGWATPASLRLTVGGAPVPPQRLGSYLRVAGLAPGDQVELRHDLPERTAPERMPSGRTYRFAWRGDEVVGVDPQDEPLPFYPPSPPAT